MVATHVFTPFSFFFTQKRHRNIMDKYLAELKFSFGKHGSWALWDKNGSIDKILQNKDFKSLIKPNIIFIGLNASYDLRNVTDWANYHFIKDKKNSSWKREPCRKLAEVISEPEFADLNGGYMTDIVKTKYDPNSGDLMKAIKKDVSIIMENKKLLKQELELLSKISKADDFQIICIGNESFNIVNQLVKKDVYKVYHYANYGEQKVKERMRQDLRNILKQ